MNRFAMIAHPVNFQQLWQLITPPGDKGPIRSRPKKLIENILKWSSPFQLPMEMKIKSATGEKILGYAIICPLLPYQMISLDEDLVIGKLVESVQLAEKNGAQIAGLAGFTSIVGNQGEKIADKVNIPITTGNTNTVSAILTQIEGASKAMGLDMAHLTVAVIGATGDIGSACSRYLKHTVSELVLCARDMDTLEKFQKEINDSHAKTRIVQKPNEAVKDADVIIAVTSAVTTIIDVELIKPGAIVCDAAMPKNIAINIAKQRDDILVFDGAMVKPHDMDAKREELDSGFVYACMAETMLLTLEKRYECYSIGRRMISMAKIDEIKEISKKHGFSSTELILKDKVYSEENIKRIREISKYKSLT